MLTRKKALLNMAATTTPSRWRTRSLIYNIGFLSQLLLLISARTVQIQAQTSVEETSNESDQNDPDPCDLFALYGNESPGWCFCDTPDVRCILNRDPSSQEWTVIGHFPTVEFMDFQNRPARSITAFPPSQVFQSMKNLLYFTMKNTGVEKVPRFAFANSTRLSDIDLSGNTIRRLEARAFGNLVNLTKINLNDNLVIEINRNVFANLPKLKVLVLSKNQIQVIHDNAFRDLRNLEDLDLRNNNISVLARDALKGLQRVKFLNLHGNMIEYIGDHTFAEMPRLQDLDLNGNKILEVSSAAFAGLKELTRLNLKDNKIVQLHPETFSHINVIHDLNLRSNELETLSYSVMKPIYENLKKSNMQILVDGNRFKCDCRILWMRTLYEETESVYVKDHILQTSCNMFEDHNKHVASEPSSGATFFHKEGDSSNITLLISPPEETTTYEFESEQKVVNLTAADFKCDEETIQDEAEPEMKSHDKQQDQDHLSQHPGTSFRYQHPAVTKSSEEEQSENSMSDLQHVISTKWNANRESPQHSSQSDANSKLQSEMGQQDASLNEPQATAALEGENTVGKAPQSTSSITQKVDNSRVSSKDVSSGSIFLRCDSVLVSSLLMVFIRLI
ncbi:unnamed protein product [Orchesella dallaii]|uniref:Connectin n=1 Tax=Orchesella dallaii TaxID=48710 RepID=A0ABP1R117_9HEXA